MSAPQQHAQAALSDDRIQEIYEQTVSYIAKDDDVPSIIAFARAILAASQQPAAAPAAEWQPIPGGLERLVLPAAAPALQVLDERAAFGYMPRYVLERLAAGDPGVMCTVTAKPMPNHGVDVAVYAEQKNK